MNIKRVFALLAIMLFSTLAIANQNPQSNIIELDNQNIGNCQRQLFTDQQNNNAYPIILLYTSQEGHEFSDIFMPTYEKVATLLHNQRTFYRYDAGTADSNVTNECLRLSGGIVAPSVIVVDKNVEAEMLSNPIRAVVGTKSVGSQVVSISPVELIAVIAMPVPSDKQNSSFTHLIQVKRSDKG